MQIRLKTINGDEFPMDVEKSSEVTKLRAEVGLRLNAESDRIRLIFAGQVLSDSDQISKYGILDDSVIHAVIRPINTLPSEAASSPAQQTAAAASRGQSSFTFTTSVSQPSNVAGTNGASGMGNRSTPDPVVSELPNGMGRFFVGSMSVDQDRNSSHTGPPDMDAIFSDMFARSVNDAMNNNDAAAQQRATAAPPQGDGRITVLRAREQFSSSMESGLCSIRLLAGSARSTDQDQGYIEPVLEEVETRAEDPSLAVAQMLSELSTGLGGLQAQLMTMSEELQTGLFTQRCTTSSSRIDTLTKIANMKVAFSNLANASQHAARSLSLLALESVPGIQPPLRPLRPFAAAAAAAANGSRTSGGGASSVVPLSADKTQSKPATTTANGKATPAAAGKPAAAKSTKLATGFLNSKPSPKQATPVSALGATVKSAVPSESSTTENNGSAKCSKPDNSTGGGTGTNSKPATSQNNSSQQRQQQQQSGGGNGFGSFPFPPGMPIPCGHMSQHHPDCSESEEEHHRMAFFHMLHNSGPEGHYHMEAIMRLAEEREIEERKEAKLAKRAKRESEIKARNALIESNAKKTAATALEAERKKEAEKTEIASNSVTPSLVHTNTSDASEATVPIDQPTSTTLPVTDSMSDNTTKSSAPQNLHPTDQILDAASLKSDASSPQTAATKTTFDAAPSNVDASNPIVKKGQAKWLPRGKGSESSYSASNARTHKGRKYSTMQAMPALPTPVPAVNHTPFSTPFSPFTSTPVSTDTLDCTSIPAAISTPFSAPEGITMSMPPCMSPGSDSPLATSTGLAASVPLAGSTGLAA